MNMHQNTDTNRRVDMESAQYRKLLMSLPKLSPSEQMPLHILARIIAAKKKDARIKFTSFAILSLGSLVSFIPLSNLVVRELTDSEFFQYLSVLFSDKNVILVAGKDALFSLVESMPLVGITISLLATMVFLYSIQITAKNIRGAFLITKLT